VRSMPHPAGRPRYLPAEDTDLLREALERFSGDSCLEIGFGSGAVLATVSGRFRLAVGTDVIGLEDARLALCPPVELVLTDRAKCFRDGVFDLVFFNPPYLPSVRIEDEAVDGGRNGVEVPVSFLEEGLRVLREEGTMVALLSDDGDLESFLSNCRGLGLSVEGVAEKRLFYETLVVFRMRRSGRRRDGDAHQS
jgi:release factor glutamine methyltransferase